jgi:hypothetical protein
MDKLLNCPFCASGKIAKCSTTDEELGATMHFIRCADCCSHSGYYSTQQEAVEQWNRRSPSAVEQAVIRVANNALYFDDNSDYGSALWEVCELLGMDKDAIGADFIEEALLAKKQ